MKNKKEQQPIGNSDTKETWEHERLSDIKKELEPLLSELTEIAKVVVEDYKKVKK